MDIIAFSQMPKKLNQSGTTVLRRSPRFVTDVAGPAGKDTTETVEPIPEQQPRKRYKKSQEYVHAAAETVSASSFSTVYIFDGGDDGGDVRLVKFKLDQLQRPRGKSYIPMLTRER